MRALQLAIGRISNSRLLERSSDVSALQLVSGEISLSLRHYDKSNVRSVVQSAKGMMSTRSGQFGMFKHLSILANGSFGVKNF